MTFIRTISEDEAAEPVAGLYAADRERLGYVANYTRLFAHRPAVYAAWQSLSAAIREAMGLRRYELVTVAAARGLRSSYCALGHGTVLADRFLGPAAVRAIIDDHRSAGLEAVDVAIMDLADKVVHDATAITQADVDELRRLGLSDAEILDVVLAAAVRCFFSKTLDALGVRPDAAFADVAPELRDALVVGRPIAEPGTRDARVSGPAAERQRDTVGAPLRRPRPRVGADLGGPSRVGDAPLLGGSSETQETTP